MSRQGDDAELLAGPLDELADGLRHQGTKVAVNSRTQSLAGDDWTWVRLSADPGCPVFAPVVAVAGVQMEGEPTDGHTLKRRGERQNREGIPVNVEVPINSSSGLHDPALNHRAWPC